MQAVTVIGVSVCVIDGAIISACRNSLNRYTLVCFYGITCFIRQNGIQCIYARTIECQLSAVICKRSVSTFKIILSCSAVYRYVPLYFLPLIITYSCNNLIGYVPTYPTSAILILIATLSYIVILQDFSSSFPFLSVKTA